MKKVVHDESNSRFVIEVDGNEAGFAEYKNVGDDVREFHHTVVNPDYRGQGLEEGQKSLTFALRFRAEDRTLTAAEASGAKLAGVAVAEQRFGARIRD